MSLVAAAVVPAAPLLVPALAGSGARLDRELRDEVLASVEWLLRQPGSALAVVGTAPVSGPLTGTWDWSGFGVEQRGSGDGRLPLGPAVGRWLLDECGAPAARLVGVADADGPADCTALGADLAAEPDLRLLVVGDGSARRTEKAPGHLDPRAEPFDAEAEKALSSGDPAALLHLDATLARDLLVAGRAPWQVLAGAAGERSWHGDLRWAQAPYGVCYLVARWALR